MSVIGSFLRRLACGSSSSLPASGQLVEMLESRVLLSGTREVHFAGLDWVVKGGSSPMGPGPNYFSNSSQSVWVDKQGLHLKIRYAGHKWCAAKVYSKLPTSYGMHRFFVTGRPDALASNVIFSPFLYATDTQEMDIEYSRWGSSSSPFNTQYVVQPSALAGHKQQLLTRLTNPAVTDEIKWSQQAVTFASRSGYASVGHIIQAWTYRGADIPSQDDGLHIHINLWMLNGQARRMERKSK